MKLKDFFTPKTEKVDEEKDLIRFLSEVELFENLTRNERKNLSQHLYERTYKADEIVFKKGYPNVVMYVVKEGELQTFLDSTEGENLKTIKTADFFGEVGLFLEEERTATIVASKDSILLGISKRDMNRFIDELPRAGSKILRKLATVLCSHLINTNKALASKRDELKNLKKQLEESECQIQELKSSQDVENEKS
ncbi:MAG TPA: cyclic nucleotide-binding domain-containing protein [Candidatus Cloacimonetes bacterium]|nr:cyclic nucleotide-binding domain-containing protein [Candidatus Cloacimonadota bacterium]HHE40654.1 cyclic nucleotide-binding domain-containing protein [Candidatus Cloacimonadota bacterium]